MALAGTCVLAQGVPPPPEAAVQSPTATTAVVAPVALAVPQALTMKEAVRIALARSPEVLAKYHAFKASEGELEAIAGALLPKVDVIASIGERRRNDPLFRGSFREDSLTLQLTQLLWDGLQSVYQKRQFGHARMVRLFEFVDASEQIALETARAYFDVLRYRELVSLAEDNLVEHRAVWQQIEARVNAGVGRRVDLQQATGRLALSESNLRVESSNLYDVSVRYQRIVGHPPPRIMDMPDTLVARIPATVAEVLKDTVLINPQVRAAVENVNASTMARDARRASYDPRVQFRIREDRGRDLNGIAGSTNNSTAEILFNFNIFNGFSDRGRVDQAESLLASAREQRDKACRDTRQTVAIAMNDKRKLDEQRVHLRQHRLSVDRARDAYRQQFEIGQRSLLDLLDTENEYFQARRAEVNASFDFEAAYVRVHAGIGRLLSMFGLAPMDPVADKATKGWGAGEEAPQHCPPEEIDTYQADRLTLDGRAEELVRRRVRTLSDLVAARTSGGALAGLAAGRGGVKPQPKPPASEVRLPQGPEGEVALALKAWSAAWAAKDTNTYLGSYAPEFAPAEGVKRGDWEIARLRALKRAGPIKLFLSGEQFTVDDPAQVTVRFLQRYASAAYSDDVEKTLVWKNVGGRWLIVRESARPAPPEAFGITPVGVPEPAAAAPPAPGLAPGAPPPKPKPRP